MRPLHTAKQEISMSAAHMALLLGETYLTVSEPNCMLYHQHAVTHTPDRVLLQVYLILMTLDMNLEAP